MIWIFFFLAQLPAHAEAPHIPAEMQQKYEDISTALRDSYREAQVKVRKADHDHDAVHVVLLELGKLWAGMKAHGRTAVIYLDQQLHEHVIGDTSVSEPGPDRH